MAGFSAQILCVCQRTVWECLIEIAPGNRSPAAAASSHHHHPARDRPTDKSAPIRADRRRPPRVHALFSFPACRRPVAAEVYVSRRARAPLRDIRAVAAALEERRIGGGLLAPPTRHPERRGIPSSSRWQRALSVLPTTRTAHPGADAVHVHRAADAVGLCRPRRLVSPRGPTRFVSTGLFAHGSRPPLSSLQTPCRQCSG